MADGVHYDESNIKSADESATVETTDRGLFGFTGKKSDDGQHVKKTYEEGLSSEFDKKAQVSEPSIYEEEKEKEKHGSLIEKLHRSGSSSSSSSSEEEVEENGEKKKKKKDKKGIKEKIKEKIKKDDHKEEDTSIPIEKVEDTSEEKKGFVEKIKEKLPGGHKKPEEAVVTPPPVAATGEDDVKEKKGFLEKIKEKLPGYHPKAEEDKEIKD